MTTTCGVLVGSSFVAADFYARRRASVLDLLGQHGTLCKKLFFVLAGSVEIHSRSALLKLHSGKLSKVLGAKTLPR